MLVSTSPLRTVSSRSTLLTGINQEDRDNEGKKKENRKITPFRICKCFYFVYYISWERIGSGPEVLEGKEIKEMKVGDKRRSS